MIQIRERCAIGIDCPPGKPRPPELFLLVLRGTGLCAADFDLQFKMLGAWLWLLKPNRKKEQLFLLNRALFTRRLQKLVGTGGIRGAVLKPEGPALVVDNERRRA